MAQLLAYGAVEETHGIVAAAEEAEAPGEVVERERPAVAMSGPFEVVMPGPAEEVATPRPFEHVIEGPMNLNSNSPAVDAELRAPEKNSMGAAAGECFGELQSTAPLAPARV